MGYWGTAILENDTASEIYDEFYSQFNNKTTVSKILADLTQTYLSVIESENSSDFWFTVGLALWETGNLTDEFQINITNCKDSDLAIWGESGGDVKKRENAVSKFLAKISIAKVNPKKPVKKRIKTPLFKIGDILAIQLEDKQYGAFYIWDANPQLGSNALLPLDIHSKELPTLESVIESKVLLIAKRRFQNEVIEEFTTIKDGLCTMTLYCDLKQHKDFAKTLTVLGNVPRINDFIYFRKLNYRIDNTGGIFPEPVNNSLLESIADFKKSVLFELSTSLGQALVRTE